MPCNRLTAYSFLRLNSPLPTLVCFSIFTDTSSVDQRPSSPEREEDSDIQETEPGGVIDRVTTTSPSRETADYLTGLEVTTENLSDASIPEVQKPSSEPLSSENTMEEETWKTAASDS